jgi:hypothetical protein
METGSIQTKANYAEYRSRNDTAHAVAKDGELSAQDLKMIAANFGDKDGKTVTVEKLEQAGFFKADAKAIATHHKELPFKPIALEFAVSQASLTGDYAYVVSSDSMAEAVSGDKMLTKDELRTIARLKNDGKLSVDDLKAAGFTDADAKEIYAKVGYAMNQALSGKGNFEAVGLTYETNIAEDVAVGVRITAGLAEDLVAGITEAKTPEDLHKALKKLETHCRATMGDTFVSGMIAGMAEKFGHIAGSIKQAPMKSLAIAALVCASQGVPGLNVAVNAALVAMGGMHVLHDIGEVVHGISSGNGFTAGKGAANLLVDTTLTAVGLKSLTSSIRSTVTFAKGEVATNVVQRGSVTHTSSTRVRKLDLTDKGTSVKFSTSSKSVDAGPYSFSATRTTLSGAFKLKGAHGHGHSVTGTMKHAIKNPLEVAHFSETGAMLGGG